MKTFNITNRLSAQAKSELQRIISTHEKYNRAYFFNPDSSASGRRRNERNFSRNNPDVAFIKGDEAIIASMSYKESCNNVYYSLTIKVIKGGVESIKNISTIKKLLNK